MIYFWKYKEGLAPTLPPVRYVSGNFILLAKLNYLLLQENEL